MQVNHNVVRGLTSALCHIVGHCMITLEQAGPSPAPGPVMITPDVVRALAGFVVRRCVEQGGGVGGFVTFGLANLQNYLGDPATDLVNTYYRKGIFGAVCS